jgi:hypothetical protein
MMEHSSSGKQIGGNSREFQGENLSHRQMYYRHENKIVELYVLLN